MLPRKKSSTPFLFVLAPYPAARRTAAELADLTTRKEDLRLLFVRWNVVARFHRPIAVVVVRVVAVSERRARYE